MTRCSWWWDNAELNCRFRQFCADLGLTTLMVNAMIAPWHGMGHYTGSFEDAVREVHAVLEWERHRGSHPQLLRDGG